MPPDQTLEEIVAAGIRSAEELSGQMAFGRARTLLAETRKQLQRGWEPTDLLRRREVEARRQHALCTYKDVDLPPGDRFDDALAILDGTDPLAVPGVASLRTTVDPETLGIAGAVHKAKWKYDAETAHLKRSLYYYNRGYIEGEHEGRKGIAADYGYTAINAAFVLDLFASIEQDDIGSDDRSIAVRRSQARKIREEILKTLPGVADERTKVKWWYAATLAEAAVGLGDFDHAAKLLEDARAAYGVKDWELESTARQLASLLQLQRLDAETKTDAWRAVSRALGMTPSTAASLLVGKFGLALSGGGFRASLFHIGVLARLAELDVLRHVEVLSCVSGGSIIGAYYYLELRELFKTKSPDRISREDYIQIVERVAREFLVGVQMNVRTRLISNLFFNWRMVWRDFSRTERIGDLFEEMIYARVQDDKERVLKRLTITPLGWSATGSRRFQPKYHNWRLEAKVPILILNATTLNTAHNWQFTVSFMGESPSSIDPEVDGNDRLRRLYYDDAPTAELQDFKLARAVGASACVPVLFEPVALDGLYPRKTVRLVDGGVHDNQGIVGIMEKDCTVLLISDASGHVGVEDDPRPSALKVATRSNDILMERVRGAQFRDLKARLRSRVIRGLMVLHLRKDLDVNPIDWANCREPSTRPERAASTSYGILKEVQEKLAAIRTDLDSFGEAEAFGLMTSGYCMTDKVFADSVGKLIATNGAREDWEFLKVRDLLTGGGAYSIAARDDFMRVLDVGKRRFFKVFYLYPRIIKAAGVARQVLLMSALIALCYSWWAFSSFPLLTAGTVASWTIRVLIGLIGLGSLTTYLFPSQTLFTIARNFAIAVVGWLAALVHLSIFDPWYLRRGRDYRT